MDVQQTEPTQTDAVTDTAFRLANAAVVPFWALMIAAPRSRVTRAVMDNRAIFVVLGVLYVALLARSMRGGDPEALRRVLRDPSPQTLGELFARPEGVTVGWIHFLAFDLFVGRWIWSDAVAEDRAPRLALGLTFMAGPAGLLTYLTGKFLRR